MEADSHYKLLMNFVLLNKATSKSVTVHQVDPVRTAFLLLPSCLPLFSLPSFSSPISIFFLLFQAFVRLTLDDMEIFYVATANDNQQYSFELDIAEAATDFGQMSGTYTLVWLPLCLTIVCAMFDLCVVISRSLPVPQALVVGDFSLENPFSWDAVSLLPLNILMHVLKGGHGCESPHTSLCIVLLMRCNLNTMAWYSKLHHVKCYTSYVEASLRSA